jgi:Glycosyl-transferase for dystroglycan
MGGHSIAALREPSPSHLRTLRMLRRRSRQQEAKRLRLCASCLALALVGVTCLAYLIRSSHSSLSSSSSSSQQQHGPAGADHHRITTSVSPGVAFSSTATTTGSTRAAAAAGPPQFLLRSNGAPACESEPESVEFTLVTQCSEDRLWMMEYHCQRWPGAVSLAVYSNASADDLELRLRELRCGGPDGDLLSVRTIRADRPDSDYPVNELRNAAFRQVRTSHVVYVDIDFWVDTNLYNVLHRNVDALQADPKLALVLPAFALRRQCRAYRDCPNRNIPRMPKTKADILENLYNRTVTAFDPTNYGGHGSTHYVEWMEQEDDELEEIDCVLSNRYEPYLVVRYCDSLPPFQPSFTGYGKNKMTWVMQLRRLGYRLGQLNSFVCHYPHLDSKARMAWEGTTEAGQHAPPRPKDPKLYLDLKRGRNDRLFLDFKRWLHSGDVPDRTIVGMCDDHLDDDAKLWVDRGGAAAAVTGRV